MGQVVQDLPKGWSIESTRFHGLNVMICEVVAGGKWTPLISVYLPTYTLDCFSYLEEALSKFWDQYPIVVGDLNANI